MSYKYKFNSPEKEGIDTHAPAIRQTINNVQTEIKEGAKKGFGDWIRSAVIFVLGSLVTLLAVAARLDPRVTALENTVSDYIEIVDADHDLNIEQSVQLQMLILHSIPSNEREILRKEAEERVNLNLNLSK